MTSLTSATGSGASAGAAFTEPPRARASATLSASSGRGSIFSASASRSAIFGSTGIGARLAVSARGAEDDPTRASARMFAVSDDLHPVDHDMRDTGRVAMRLGIRRVVRDGRGVEDGDVGEEPRPQEPAAIQLQILRGEAGHAPDDVLQRSGALVTHEA